WPSGNLQHLGNPFARGTIDEPAGDAAVVLLHGELAHRAAARGPAGTAERPARRLAVVLWTQRPCAADLAKTGQEPLSVQFLAVAAQRRNAQRRRRQVPDAGIEDPGV